jgi:hypothetical protein
MLTDLSQHIPMADDRRKRQPGDLILDRYMPDASPEQREGARANLYEFAGVLLRIATRRVTEEHDKSIRASRACTVESDYGSPPYL